MGVFAQGFEGSGNIFQLSKNLSFKYLVNNQTRHIFKTS